MIEYLHDAMVGLGGGALGAGVLFVATSWKSNARVRLSKSAIHSMQQLQALDKESNADSAAAQAAQEAKLKEMVKDEAAKL